MAEGDAGSDHPGNLCAFLIDRISDAAEAEPPDQIFSTRTGGIFYIQELTQLKKQLPGDGAASQSVCSMNSQVKKRSTSASVRLGVDTG